MKTVLKKILNVRDAIKNTSIKKLGRNEFSKYDYFTPEQIDQLTFIECKKQGLFNKYDLKRTELGLIATMIVFDIEGEDALNFELAMEIPEIKATNISQQLGGAMTYSKRYLLMNIYDISDNSLDFDSQEPSKKQSAKTETNTEKQWLNPKTEQWTKAVAFLKEGHKIDEIKKKYNISKVNQEQLISESI